MMKRLYFLLVLLIVCTVSVQAKGVDSTRLATYATNFLYALQQADNVRSVSTVNSVNGKTNLAVVALTPSGWVLMATDDVAEPVLGYNLTGHFTLDSTLVNPGFTHLLRSYDKHVQVLKLNPDQPVNEKWSTSRVRTRSATVASSVAPLITVEWNQGSNWNQSCPVDASGPGGHVYVGCVAVAMGQAMTVYQYPTKGTGTTSYIAEGYGYQSVNFEDYGNYVWSNMMVNSPNKDIADFLYHCAVSVKMSFGADASGAYTKTAATALKTYFGYSSSTDCIEKGGTDAEWTALLNAELDAGRPLIYAGDAGDNKPGHAFNIDGYVLNDNTSLYHLNWGWSGSNNGYFSINVLNPGSYNFSSNNQVIVGLKPIKPGPTDLSLSKSSVNAGLPVGSEVAAIVVSDEWSGNAYTYSLSGTLDLNDEERPLYFREENGMLKTTKEFQYLTGGRNIEGVVIKVTDKYGNSLSKTFNIDILPKMTAGIDRVADNGKLVNLQYSTAEGLLTWDALSEPVHVAVYSVQGRLLSEQTTTANRLQVELPQGMYLVRLTAKDARQTIKLVSPSFP